MVTSTGDVYLAMALALCVGLGCHGELGVGSMLSGMAGSMMCGVDITDPSDVVTGDNPASCTPAKTGPRVKLKRLSGRRPITRSSASNITRSTGMPRSRFGAVEVSTGSAAMPSSASEICPAGSSSIPAQRSFAERGPMPSRRR